MDFSLHHPAEQLIMIMDRIYGYGMTTTSGGNLSIMDENGDVWITPAGKDKGSLVTEDIVCIKPDGKFIGALRPSSEYPFHLAAYKSRPEIKAVLHAHPPALVAYSITRTIPNTRINPTAYRVCGDIRMAPYATPGTEELGVNIAAELETGANIIMLENHGVLIAGETLFEAFERFETLDFCARLQIKAARMGKAVDLTDEQLSMNKAELAVLPEFTPAYHSSEEKRQRREMITLIHRAYDQKLFTSTEGTFSSRTGDDSFIITPYNRDRKYIDIDDLVLVNEGKRESGKNPSRSAVLHRLIYQRNPEINSIIIAHPPNIMAFGITNTEFDTRTIPECYVMLRDIPLMPYGSSFTDREGVADKISTKSPLIIFRNNSLLVTGSNLLNAFDRLEVAEFSAKAVLAAKKLGEIVFISDEQVENLKTAFGL